jgi:peroxiredoxin Q/BCP
MKRLNSGDKAPHFDLKDQNSKHVRLSDFTGKRLFLYFYPKANTSG